MNKYLITGVSSGIGKALTEKLISSGDIVWGIARRGNLLEDLKRELNSKGFYFTRMDQAKDKDWKTLLSEFKKEKFIPEIVIFNAAIQKYDLENGINIENLEETMEVNFLGVMRGISNLYPLMKSGSQIVAISTFSALKGSSTEGIGYASSKAALSVGFESLYQKYYKDILFKTIYFGPIDSGMGPFKKNVPFILNENQTIKFIIKALKSKQGQYYYPKIIFLIMKLIKLLPSPLYFRILSLMESVHSKFT